MRELPPDEVTFTLDWASSVTVEAWWMYVGPAALESRHAAAKQALDELLDLEPKVPDDAVEAHRAQVLREAQEGRGQWRERPAVSERALRPIGATGTSWPTPWAMRRWITKRSVGLAILEWLSQINIDELLISDPADAVAAIDDRHQVRSNRC
jgi:hypothetical protein